MRWIFVTHDNSNANHQALKDVDDETVDDYSRARITALLFFFAEQKRSCAASHLRGK